MNEEIQPSEVRDWLARLRGPGFNQNRRDETVAKMRKLGAERLFPYLRDILNDPDAEFRCLASLGIVYTDPKAGMDLLLPLLDDPDVVVRWHTCGLMHDIGDQRAVEPLIQRMKTDRDPQVRNTAAYALGGVGDPSAIPALIETLDNDHEFDELGHSASSCAATSLDDIIKTNHTRIKVTDTLCTMSLTSPDLALLKSQAMEVYRNRS